MDLEEHLKRLYSAPLAEFTATRNAIATDLKEEDPAAAAAIKKLKKPTLSVWVVDQLATDRPDGIATLLDEASSMRQALEDGDTAAARAAGKRRKAILSKLTERAAEILVTSGHAAGTATIDRVSTTLLVGSTDDEAAAAIRSGTLDHDVEASGLEAFSAMAGMGAIQSTEEDEAPEDSSAERDRLRTRARELGQRAADLEATAAGLELDAQRATRAAAKARKEAEKARSEADRAEAEATVSD